MGRDRVILESHASEDMVMRNYAGKRIINLGCGFKKVIGATNVDAFPNCEPDVVWDLNDTPWPWVEDDSVDEFWAHHVFEHLKRDRWWGAFCECARKLKVGGILDIRVPDESSSSALAYRDHNTIITYHSFQGIKSNTGMWCRGATNAWAKTVEETVPLECIYHVKVPFADYMWLKHFPRLMGFLAHHMRNFIWEQIFVFQKIEPDREEGKDGK